MFAIFIYMNRKDINDYLNLNVSYKIKLIKYFYLKIVMVAGTSTFGQVLDTKIAWYNNSNYSLN